MHSKQVFILLTNKHSAAVMALYRQLELALAHLGDLWIVYHLKTESVPEVIQSARHHVFTDQILYQLNYTPIRKTLIPGSAHFPLLDFYRHHNGYDHYWLIEDDVRFNGSWTGFFEFFSNQTKHIDFITSHLRTFYEERSWPWWYSLMHERHFIPFGFMVRSFNPIYRMSNAALEFIDEALTDQWQGHHEVLLPTLLFLEGFAVADFGGSGQFVNAGQENLFYTSGQMTTNGVLNRGTMRFRPVIDLSEMVDNKLYHPVKL